MKEIEASAGAFGDSPAPLQIALDMAAAPCKSWLVSFDTEGRKFP